MNRLVVFVPFFAIATGCTGPGLDDDGPHETGTDDDSERGDDLSDTDGSPGGDDGGDEGGDDGTDETGDTPEDPGLHARFTARPIQGTTCLAPCAVHFDAIGDGTNETTDDTIPRPFHDLDFRWDFGDATGESWDVSGVDKNTATGAIAGHTYEAPGTYTVNLRVTNPAGGIATVSDTVVVADADEHFEASDTYCFANDASDWSGCPLDCAGGDDNCTVITDWLQLVSQGENCSGAGDCADADAAPRRILLRRGDTFTSTMQVVFSNDGTSPGQVTAFGSGPAPVIQSNGRTDWGSGWTISDVEVHGGQTLLLLNDVHNVTFVRVDVEYTATCIEEAPLDLETPENTDVGSLHAYIEVNCTGVGSTSYSTWPGADYVLWMGGTFDKNGGSESTLRSHHMQHYLIQHTRWIDGAAGREHWQFRAFDEFNGLTPEEEANRFVLLSDNVLDNPGSGDWMTVRVCVDSGCNCGEGAAECGGASIGAGKIVNVSDFIFERNFFSYSQDGVGTRYGVFELQGGDFTIRNNVVDLQGMSIEGANFVVATGEPTQHTSGATVHGNYHIEHNTIYADDAATGTFRFATPRGSYNGSGCIGSCLSRNNVLVDPNFQGTVDDDATFLASGNQLVTTGNPFVGEVPSQGDSAIGDFRLGTSGSSDALVDAGTAFAADGDGYVREDALGFCRPAGEGWDVGAFERDAEVCQPAGH